MHFLTQKFKLTSPHVPKHLNSPRPILECMQIHKEVVKVGTNLQLQRRMGNILKHTVGKSKRNATGVASTE